MWLGMELMGYWFSEQRANYGAANTTAIAHNIKDAGTDRAPWKLSPLLNDSQMLLPPGERRGRAAPERAAGLTWREYETSSTAPEPDGSRLGRSGGTPSLASANSAVLPNLSPVTPVLLFSLLTADLSLNKLC
ncbi:hypothetical protein SKAU_G00114600 [Synaphobranchus kaupii]|uniref:Uncharacterized protein n=1 Tax=Synaphobranchus kaupii TaxID=118154 RepID=A0A9Q1J0U5_SYNKA|nr:hypothetical protein SKAU_G00114600 [Synaphobranchus kaupii]